MIKLLYCLVILALFSAPVFAQKRPASRPEFKVAYFGDYVARPGIRAGVAYPFAQKTKEKEKYRGREVTYILTKIHRLEVGGSFTFYHHPKDHNGYLFNAELIWHRIRNKSYKVNKYKHFEMALGLGWFRYQLLGTTFKPEDGTFKEINGNGNAFMPNLSAAWGKNLRFIKAADVRLYLKPNLLFEIPFGAGFKTHFAFEAGLASTLSKNSKK